MPFYQDFSDDHAIILSWKYGEEDHFDKDRLIHPNEIEKVKNYHPKKVLEHLMVRELLYRQFPSSQIHYKPDGEPYLNPETANISITHSFPFASIAISKHKVGIDLEKVSEKILKIKHKFLHESEIQWTEDKENEAELLTIIWVIKESLYKMHSSKYWSLKKHYEVSEFDLENLDALECRVFDESFCDEFSAKVTKIEDYYFAKVLDEA